MNNQELERVLLRLTESDAKEVLREMMTLVQKPTPNPLTPVSSCRAPGVYIIADASREVLYVGETGNIGKRRRDLFRTKNHSFRRTFGKDLLRKSNRPNEYGGSTSENFSDTGEVEITQAMQRLMVHEVPLWIGRKELEEAIVASEKKRRTNRNHRLYNIRLKRA